MENLICYIFEEKGIFSVNIELNPQKWWHIACLNDFKMICSCFYVPFFYN